MSAKPKQRDKLLTPRKIVIQLVGFTIGLALLFWCIKIAVKGGDWSKVLHAPPALIAGLIGCTLVSLVVNGASFWIVIRPVQPLRFIDLLWINLVTGILNYAPIRAGLIARVAYHMRCDGMSLFRVGAWLGSLAYTTFLTIGACIFSTIVWPKFDMVWLGLVLSQLALGGVLVWAMMGQSIVQRYAQGIDRMLRDPTALWGAIALRLVDVAAFVGRMACAIAILGLPLGLTDTLLLGFAAIGLTMNPLGRFGFREIVVTIIASRLVSADMSGTELSADMAQLALVESAGEALLYVPLGLVSLVWFKRKWARGRTGLGVRVTEDCDTDS